MVAKAASNSLGSLAFRTRRRTPRVRAATCNSLVWASAITALVGLTRQSDRSCRGHQFVKQLKAFGLHRGIEVVYARDIATRSVEAGDETRLNRICTR